MFINVSKTECMHLQIQDKVRKPSATEAEAKCKFVCRNCGNKYATKQGLRIHSGKCKWKDVYEAEKIVDHRPDASNSKCRSMPIGYGKTFFKVRWKGYDSDADQWRPYEDIHPQLIKGYLQAKGLYNHQWPHRCPVCDKPATSERGVKIHCSRKKGNCRHFLENTEQNFTGTIAEKKCKKKQLEDQQEQRPAVRCDGEKLVNCFLFRYLGSMFAADGSQEHDVTRRIGIAQTRAGKL